MLRLNNALVVDDSKVMRHVMRAVLAPHVAQVVTAADLDEGTRLLDDVEGDVELVLCDVHLPDGDGFAILGHVARHSPTSRVILISGRKGDGLDERAAEAGAIGFLSKPVAIGDIDRLWAQSAARGVDRADRIPFETDARVRDLDGQRLVRFGVRNLSESGAFLETNGPLERGQALDLELFLDDEQVEVRARVVRIQEPSWLYPGGVGVQFEGVDDETGGALEAALKRRREDLESPA